MKTTFNFILLLAGIVILTACSENNPTNTDTANTIKNGTWKITYYYDTDHEETSSFAGFSFTFANNNVVTATNGIITVTGSWNTGTDDSQAKLILNFPTTASFDELNDDWHVIELTDTKIRLEDVSGGGGGGGTDYLTFEKE